MLRGTSLKSALYFAYLDEGNGTFYVLSVRFYDEKKKNATKVCNMSEINMYETYAFLCCNKSPLFASVNKQLKN